MASSKATTVSAYLKELPAERRAVISTVRDVVRKNLPKGYREAMSFGMIAYEIPLETYPDTYNGHPLAYVALAAQKNYYTLYLMGAYADPKVGKSLAPQFKARGKKLDMGKSCLRFKSLDDLPLDVIGNVIAAIPVDQMVAFAKKAHTKRAR
jgi:hypothetical protein